MSEFRARMFDRMDAADDADIASLAHEADIRLRAEARDDSTDPEFEAQRRLLADQVVTQMEDDARLTATLLRSHLPTNVTIEVPNPLFREREPEHMAKGIFNRRKHQGHIESPTTTIEGWLAYQRPTHGSSKSKREGMVIDVNGTPWLWSDKQDVHHIEATRVRGEPLTADRVIDSVAVKDDWPLERQSAVVAWRGRLEKLAQKVSP